MDLDLAMTTTFACREFTDDPVTDEEVEAIVDLARFAPSGGNRQPNRVVAIRDANTKAELRRIAEQAMRVYMAQMAAGEAPWNTINPTSVDVEGLWNADEPIEFLAFDYWHYYGRTAKHGAFMGGADFVQWHGNYELLHYRVKIEKAIKELRAAG